MAVQRQSSPSDVNNTDVELLDTWSRDEILAPNSDTECEPLSKRHKQIKQIAQYYRDGGELFLISTTFRGPITNNPWARRTLWTTVTSGEKPNVTKDAERHDKRKRKRTSKKAVVTNKDNKVSRYFPAQKSSQGRDIVQKMATVKKYAVEKDDPIVCDDTLIESEPLVTEHPRTVVTDNSSQTFKAVPRMIDFGQIPPSTDIPSQNFPTLQLVKPKPPVRTHLKRSDCIDSSAGTSSIFEKQTDPDVGSVDAPTPEGNTVSKPTVPHPTPARLESTHNLLGDESQSNCPVPMTSDDAGLYDNPTPPQIPKLVNSPGSDIPILPTSLTNHPSPSFSPIKAGPLEISHFVEKSNPLNPSKHSTRSRSPKKSSKKSHNSSSFDLPRAPLQRSQTQNAQPQLLQVPSTTKISTPITPPLNTQSMLDLANRSFNAVIEQSQPTSSPSLLPPAPLAAKIVSSPISSGFTPFRELNKSPVRDGLSFNLSSLQESPLTYSPGQQTETAVEELLWGEVKGLLGTWNLDEEIEKHKKTSEGNKGQSVEESANASRSQECIVAA
jgi:hypothetical protein